MSDWWRFDNQGWRGQSSTVGAVLLAAVALVLVAAVGLFVFSDFGGSGESNELLLTDLGSDLTASNVTISHKGGDTLTPDEVTVLIKGANETTEISLDEFRRSGDQFTAGDVAEYTETDPTEFFIGEFTLLVVHDPSSTILHESEKSISFAKQGITLAVESKKGGLATGTTDVWGKPASNVTLSNPSEVEWDFSVSARFTEGTGQTITDDIGDAYTLSVPSQGFDGRSVSNGNSLGVLEAARVNSDTTVTVKAEYVGDNAPAGTPSNRKTSTVDVTVADPSETFDISGSIDDTTSNGQINADYTITNAGDLSIEQDISYTAIAYDASGSKVEEKTGTSITGVSSGDLTASLSPGSSTGGTVNYEPPQNTEEVELRITPQIGNKFQATETFTPADFQIQNAAWSVNQDSAELANDYDITNAGSFSGTTDVTFDATAYDSSGNPIDAAGYSGVTYTNSYTNVQVDSGETLTTANGQIAPFTVPLPPGTDSVTTSISTLNDTETKTLDTTPAEFAVTDVSITGISSPSNEVTVSYDIENQGGLADTQDIALKAFDDTGSGFPGTADSTTTDSGVSLAPGETYSNTVTFHTVDPTTDAVKVEVVPGGAPALGSAGQDTTSIASANQVVTLDTVGLEHDESNDIDEIVVGFTVENTGDLTYNSPQPVDITFNNGGSVTKTVQATVQAGDSKSFTVRSGSLRSAFSSPAGTYTVSGRDDGSGDTKTLQVDSAIAQITVTGQNFDPTAQELSVDYSVINTGDLTDDIRADLYTLDGPGGSRLDSTPLDQSSATELTSGSSTSGTLTHGVRGKDIISSTVHFEVFANPSAPGSNSDSATGSISGISPPNFAIDTFTVTPDFANGKLTTDYTVKNNGGLTATRDISLSVSVGGSQVFSDTKSGTQLTPGETISESYTPAVTDPGSPSTVTVTLDTEDNSDTKSLSVTPATFDVSGVSATYDPAAETATVEYNVTNTGDFTDTQTITATALADGTSSENTNVQLGPGESTGTKSLTVDINSAGSQTLEVSTDDDTGTDSISPAAALFDISITSATISNGKVTANYEVDNTGDFSDAQDLILRVDGTDRSQTNVTLAPSDAPRTGSLTSIPLSPPSDGQFTVEVVGSGNSNDASTTLSVSAPSFQITSFSASFDTANSELVVEHTVTNKNADFPDTQDIVTRVDGTTINTDGGVSLNPGEQRSNTVTYNINSGGTYTVKVSTDDDSRSAGVSVAGTNFDVRLNGADPARVTGAGEATVEFTIKNTGDLASGTQTITAEALTDGTTATTSVGPLSPGQETAVKSLTVPVSSPGTQDVEVRTSGPGDSERDSIDVAGPSVSVSATNLRVTSGNKLAFDYEVSNAGSADLSTTRALQATVSGPETPGVDTGVSNPVTLAPGDSVSKSGVTTDNPVSSGGDYTVEVTYGTTSDSVSLTVNGPSISVDVRNLRVQNDEIVWDYEVSNAGSADLSATRDLQATVSGPPATSADVTNPVTLAPGDSVSKSGLTTLSDISTGGTYTVELSYGGASDSQSITVAGPNFDVRLNGADPAKVTGAGEATVEFTIKNTGDLTSGTQTITAEALTDGTTETTSVGPLSPGQETGVKSLTVGVSSPGTQDVEVRTSGPGDSERDGIDVAGPSVSVSVTNLQLTGSKELRFDYTVSNAGSADLSTTRDLQATVSGPPATSADVSNPVTLAPGDSVSKSGVTTDSPVSSGGDYTVTVSYGSASGSATVSVAGPSISVDVRNLRVQNGKLAFDYEVSNAGSADLAATRNVQATVSGPETPGVDTGVSNPVTIAPGDSVSKSGVTTQSAVSSSGQYTVELTYGSASDSQSITVAGPNFDVRLNGADPARVTGAGEATVEFTIKNTGDLASGTQTITAEALTDGTTATTSVGPLSPGQETGVKSLTVGVSSPGTQDVEVRTSGPGDSERDSIDVAGPSVSVSATNLRVTSGNKLAFDYEVSNAGSADLAATRNVQATVSGPETPGVDAGVSNPVTLAPGDSVSKSGVTTDSPVSSGGDYTVTVSYGSASGSATVSVAGPSISVDVRNLRVQNDKIVWDYEVSNAGSADLAATRDLQATVSGPPATSADVTNPVTLAPGDSVSKSGLTTLSDISTGGTYTIELSYGGASDSQSITVAGPNFDVRLNGADPARVTGAGEATVEFTIKNTGDLTSGTQTITAEALTDGTTATTSVGPLSPGQETGVKSLTVGVSSPGTQDVEVRTSGPGDSERDSIDVAGPSVSVSVTNLQLTGSKELRFDYTVSNAGSADLAATRNLQATVSGPPATSADVTNPVTLAPGDSVSKSGLTTNNPVSSGGDYTVTVSYGSASGSATVSVAGPSISVDVRNLRVQNDKLKFDYEISNAGSADLAATRDVSASLSGSPATGPGVSNPVTIAPGDSISQTLSSNNKLPGAGTYTAEVTYGGASDSESLAVDGPSITVTVNNPRIQNQEFKFDYTISNANSAELSSTGDVSASISGSPATGPGVSNPVTIAPGDSISRTLSSNSKLPPGDASYTGEVTYAGVSDTASASVNSNLDVQLVGGNPATYTPSSETASIDYTVENTGNIRATPTVTVEALGDNNQNSRQLSTISPGDTTSTQTDSVNIDSAGSQNIEVRTADDSERDSIDVSSATFEITSSSFNYNMDEGGELDAGGEVLRVDYTVKNVGGVRGSTNINLQPGFADSTTLDPGATFSQSVYYFPDRNDGPTVDVTLSVIGDSVTQNIPIYAEPELSSLSTSRSKYVWKCGGSFTIQIGFFCGPGSWEHQFKAGFDYSISDPGNDLGSFSVDVVNTDRSADGLSGEWPTLDESSTSENGNLTVQHTESGYCPSPRPRCVSELSDNPAKFDIDFTVTDDFGDTTDDASDEDFSVINGEEAGLVGAELDMSSIELKDIAGTFADSDGNLNVDAKLKWSADVSNNADKLLIVPTEPDSGFGDNRGPAYKEIVYDPSKKSDLENGDIEINFETDDGATDATLNFKFLDENGSVLTTLKESTGESNKKIEWGGSTQFDAGDIDISNVEYSSGGRPGFDASCPEVDKDDSGFFGSDREQCISNLEVNLDVDWDQSIEPETDVDKVKFIPYDTRGGENFLVDNTDSQGEFTGSLNNIHTDTSNSKYNFLRFEIHHCQFGRQGISTDNVNVKLKYLDSNGNPIPITTGDKSSTTSYKLGNPPGNFGTFGGFLSEKGDDDNPDKNNNNNIDCSNEPGNKPN